jgi:hypothetical protein
MQKDTNKTKNLNIDGHINLNFLVSSEPFDEFCVFYTKWSFGNLFNYFK